jgi:hypothetical protein
VSAFDLQAFVAAQIGFDSAGLGFSNEVNPLFIFGSSSLHVDLA